MEKFCKSFYLFKLWVCLFVYLFIYIWLCWVFVSVRGLSLVAASGGHSSSRCTSLSLSRPLLLWSTGSRSAGSGIVAHGPSCSAACRQILDHCATREALQILLNRGQPYLISKSFSSRINASCNFKNKVALTLLVCQFINKCLLTCL